MQLRLRLDRVRRPEYTGENRCRPCTVVNVAIAAALSAAVATVAVALAVPVFALSVVVIYVRGYLIPYTPTLTTRYLPESVLVALGKEDAPAPADTAGDLDVNLAERRENAVDVDAFLREHDVVDPADGDANRLQLTDAFTGQLERQLAAVDAGDIDEDAVASLFDAGDASALDRDYPAYEVGIRIRKWPSETAIRVDVAAHRTLAELAAGWCDVPDDQRAAMLALVRRLLEECPACGDRLVETNETVESCCINVEKYAVRCTNCDTHVREYDDPTELEGKGLTGA